VPLQLASARYCADVYQIAVAAPARACVVWAGTSAVGLGCGLACSDWPRNPQRRAESVVSQL